MDCHLASVQAWGPALASKMVPEADPKVPDPATVTTLTQLAGLLATPWRPTIAASAAEQYRRCCRVGRPGPHR